MKRILMGICDIFTLLFLTGGYMVQSFTRQKLGMMRWINFHTYKYQEALPLDLLKYVAIAAAALLTVWVIWRFMKRRKTVKITDKIMLVIMAAVTLLYVGFTVFSSMETTRAYYFVLPLLGMASLMQIIKNFVITGKRKNDEK